MDILQLKAYYFAIFSQNANFLIKVIKWSDNISWRVMTKIEKDMTLTQSYIIPVYPHLSRKYFVFTFDSKHSLFHLNFFFSFGLTAKHCTPSWLHWLYVTKAELACSSRARLGCDAASYWSIIWNGPIRGCDSWCREKAELPQSGAGLDCSRPRLGRCPARFDLDFLAGQHTPKYK